MPLYFLFVGLGFFLCKSFPNDVDTIPPIGYWLSFTVNQFMATEGADFLFFMTILWSLCLEMQFYVLWAVVIKLGKAMIFWMSFALIILSPIFRYYFKNYSGDDFLYFHSLSYATNFGTGALLAFISTQFKELRLSPRLITLGYVFFALFIIFYPSVFSNSILVALEPLVFSLIFFVIIHDLTCSEKPLVNPGKFKTLSALGRLSYGFYLFHALVISCLIVVSKYLPFTETFPIVLLINPIVAIMVTFVLAHLSAKFFEKPLINYFNNQNSESKQRSE